MKRPLALLFLLSTLLSLSSACIHDQFAKEILQEPDSLMQTPETPDGRMLVTSPDSMRIVAYYFIDGYSTRIQEAISQQIIPAAIAYYQKALKVKRFPSNIPLDSTRVNYCVEQAPRADMPASVAADLVLLVTAVTDTSSSYIAAAGACYQEGTTHRPYMGIVKFNTAFGFSDDTEFNYRNQLYTILHEIGHVLGFSKFLYDSYIDPLTNLPLSSPYTTKTVNGVSQTVLTLDALTSKVQDYFGCTTDNEIALIEQQGGDGSAGSHFERRIFMNEFMTASATIDSRISEIFFALLEGTGWYYPDYTMAEPMFWGKDQGCDFINTPCLVSKQTDFPDHFCETLDVDSCTFTREAYGVCGNTVKTDKDSSIPSAWNYFGNKISVLDSFSDNCPYYYSYSFTECQDSSNSAINLDGGEYFGEGSSCFTGTLGNSGTKVSKAPFCFKYTCDFSSGTKVKVTVGSTTVTCSAAGTKTVPGYFGTLTCPDPVDFCGTSGASFCPRGCMGRGTCSSGVCSCDPGYDGDDCSYTGVMSFSGIKGRYAIDAGTAEEKTSISKIIIYAAVGAGAVIVIAVVALVITKYRRAKARKAAVKSQEQRRQERRQNRQNRQNDYAVNGNPSPQANYVDPRGINVGVVQQQQQPVQMITVMPQQQYYAQNQNPRMQMQANMVYYPEANVYQDQNGNIYPGPPQSHVNPQQNHRVHIPR